jgi:4-oxalocrotonate tautomerase
MSAMENNIIGTERSSFNSIGEVFYQNKLNIHQYLVRFHGRFFRPEYIRYKTYASINNNLARITMPYVNIQVTKGLTREQKSQLVKEVTDSIVRILAKKPEHIHIVIQEIAEEDWGFSGLLTDDWKQQQNL